MSTTHYSELMIYELVMDWVYELGIEYPIYDGMIEVHINGDGEVCLNVPAYFTETRHYQDLQRMILEPNKTSGERTGWDIDAGESGILNQWITIWSK